MNASQIARGVARGAITTAAAINVAFLMASRLDAPSTKYRTCNCQSCRLRLSSASDTDAARHGRVLYCRRIA